MSTHGGNGSPVNAREQRVIDLGGSQEPELECNDVLIVVEGQNFRVNQQTLLHDDHCRAIRDAVSAENEVVVDCWENILLLNDQAQDALLAVLAGAIDRVRAPGAEPGAEPVLPFQAALEIQPEPNDLEALGRWRRLLAGLAGLLHPNAPEEAARHIQDAMQRNGFATPNRNTIQREVRDAAERFLPPNPSSPEGAAALFLADVNEEAESGGVNKLRYFQDEFYRWTERTWKRLGDGEFKSTVTRFLQHADVGVDITESFVKSVITNLKGMTLLGGWEERMPFWITNEDPIQISRPRYIAFNNGMVNVDDAINGGAMQLYQHSPRFFSTVLLPYDFQPDADCPLFGRTLEEIFPRREEGDRRVEVLQEFMGLSLIHGDLRFEKFLVLVGLGANGKSTLLNAWKPMLGEENVSHVPLDALGQEFRLHQMAGKLANIASDMKRMDKLEEGRLKELVSGERLQVNRKNKEPITMTPTARLVFATNHMPQINDRSDGLWRRLIVIPFHESFQHAPDLNRAQQLTSELSGIFNWAL
ncbi:MAG: phage/plasmid primase, P4 family, partial [Planctomycetales bacterium]